MPKGIYDRKKKNNQEVAKNDTKSVPIIELDMQRELAEKSADSAGRACARALASGSPDVAHQEAGRYQAYKHMADSLYRLITSIKNENN